MSSDDETFETSDSGSSLTYPVSAGDLKKGDILCIKGFPCRITDIAISKTGKHGHAKAAITAIDIFTGRKMEVHRLPPDEELANRIKAGFESGEEMTVVVQKAMNIEQVVSIKQGGSKV